METFLLRLCLFGVFTLLAGMGLAALAVCERTEPELVGSLVGFIVLGVGGQLTMMALAIRGLAGGRHRDTQRRSDGEPTEETTP
jgi:hypothetical protein